VRILPIRATAAVWAALATVLACQGLRPDSAAPPCPPLVQRFLDSTGQAIVSYHAVRRLYAQARGGSMKATMTAETSLDPEHGFRFQVLAEDGSGLIRTKVFHPALEAEQAMRTDSAEQAKGAIDPRNYDFTVGPSGEDGLIGIAIEPKRSDKLLIRGHIFVSEADGDLVRIEGELVKRPSFWTRRVDVVRRYTRMLGVRVPIVLESTAKILLAGTSTFSMTYDYEEINGVPLKGGRRP
jgi:hypothetical protein